MISDVRNFWDARPCNIKHSNAPVGTKQWSDEVTQRKYFVEPHIPTFAAFEKWRGKRVLEIGTGIGTDALSFAQHGAHVVATDISKVSLDLAKCRVELNKQKVTFYQGNAEWLNMFVPIEPYDLIYSFGVIHHTPQPENIVEQLKYYTKSDTIIKVMLYHRYSWKVFSLLARHGLWHIKNIDKFVAMYSEAQEGCPYTYTYTKESARKLFKDFEVLSMNVYHIFPYRIKEYIKHQYVKQWYFNIMPPPLFNWLERNFGWHLCMTMRLKS